MRHPAPSTLAKYLRKIANLVESYGDRAVDLARVLAEHGYPTGGDGTGGGPSILVDDEDGHPDRVPVTTTEAAAMNPNQFAGLDHELARALRETWSRSRRLEDLIHRTGAPNRPTTPRTARDDVGEDWCNSCYRDNHHLEPVALHPDGRTKYRGACRWCGSFHAQQGQWPPLALLEAHHRGTRITQQMVERHLGRRAS